MSVINVSNTQNPFYQTIMQCTRTGTTVIFDTPETTMLALQQNWESRLPGAASRALAARDGVAAVTGGFVQIQQETRQIWNGGSPMELPFTVLLDAKQSARTDVYDASLKLLAMAIPDQQGQLLFAPGPRDRFSLNGAIIVQVGRYLRMDDTIMTSIQPTYDTKIAKDGYPISCSVEFTLRSASVWGMEDFRRNFMMPSN